MNSGYTVNKVEKGGGGGGKREGKASPNLPQKRSWGII